MSIFQDKSVCKLCEEEVEKGKLKPEKKGQLELIECETVAKGEKKYGVVKLCTRCDGPATQSALR